MHRSTSVHVTSACWFRTGAVMTTVVYCSLMGWRIRELPFSFIQWVDNRDGLTARWTVDEDAVTVRVAIRREDDRECLDEVRVFNVRAAGKAARKDLVQLRAHEQSLDSVPIPRPVAHALLALI